MNCNQGRGNKGYFMNRLKSRHIILLFVFSMLTSYFVVPQFTVYAGGTFVNPDTCMTVNHAICEECLAALSAQSQADTLWQTLVTLLIVLEVSALIVMFSYWLYARNLNSEVPLR